MQNLEDVGTKNKHVLKKTTTLHDQLVGMHRSFDGAIFLPNAAAALCSREQGRARRTLSYAWTVWDGAGQLLDASPPAPLL